MKKLAAALALVLALALGHSAAAEKVILSTATTTTSSVYKVGGLFAAFIQIEAASGTADATVIVEQRMGPHSSWQTVQTVVSPVAGAVAYRLEPCGEVRVRVPAWNSGTVLVTLTGYALTGTEMTW